MAQRPTSENLKNFDKRKWHFGFTIGINRSDFFLDAKPDIFLPDSLFSILPARAPGFNLGIIAQLHLTENIGVRFIPALSFQDRIVQYSFVDASTRTGFLITEKRVESTYLEFPINFKFRTNRINNFAAYLVAGGKLGIDMASQIDVDQTLGDIVLKINRNDWSAEGGVGFDFFLPYFKFGIELKQSVGVRNVLFDDMTKFSTPIDRLLTKNFLISFTFEG